MSYEFQHRGDMWFGNVYDVYESGQWIGGVMQGAQNPRWSAVTPYGRGAEPLPFETREQAAAWLDDQGVRVPKTRKWRFSPPAYAVLGPVKEQLMAYETTNLPTLGCMCGLGDDVVPTQTPAQQCEAGGGHIIEKTGAGRPNACATGQMISGPGDLPHVWCCPAGPAIPSSLLWAIGLSAAGMLAWWMLDRESYHRFFQTYIPLERMTRRNPKKGFRR